MHKRTGFFVLTHATKILQLIGIRTFSSGGAFRQGFRLEEPESGARPTGSRFRGS
jgi:hypothetical protein